MSQRQVSPAIYEYTCDECGTNRQQEWTPKAWVHIQTSRWDAVRGQMNKTTQLCDACGELEKYAWTVAR